MLQRCFHDATCRSEQLNEQTLRQAQGPAHKQHTRAHKQHTRGDMSESRQFLMRGSGRGGAVSSTASKSDRAQYELPALPPPAAEPERVAAVPLRARGPFRCAVTSPPARERQASAGPRRDPWGYPAEHDPSPSGNVVTEAQAAMLVEATKLVEARSVEQALRKAAEVEAAAMAEMGEARAEVARLEAALRDAEVSAPTCARANKRPPRPAGRRL
eukprot:7379883-Prymnesium_polylepis.1